MDSSLKPQVPQYYYSVTGDVVLGNNQKSQEYQNGNDRFPMGTTTDIYAQTESWGVQKGGISPLYELAPDTSPFHVSKAFQNVSVPQPHNA